VSTSATPAVKAAPRAPLHTFLAIDFGTKRTGIAVGNGVFRTAQALGSIKCEGKARFGLIQRYVDEWQPDGLVIGVPYHPDGAPNENTEHAKKFGRQLNGHFRLPVFEVDERYSTTEAIASGAQDHDAESAKIILEQYFRNLP
jgi:putative Holliday junction resolvase